jgi:hypothetical protein
MKAHSKAWLALPFATALLSYSVPVSALDVGVVNVDLRNAKILQNIANHLSVNISNIPITVQVPISVAANVCDVNVAVLTAAITKGGASCYAQSTSAALNKIVQKVINLQTQ